MLAESFVRSGKVRDLYRLDDGRLLLVASDRISAFDVVLPSIIADKGRVLTGLSRFWFAETAGIIANHLLATAPEVLAAAIGAEDGWAGRHAPEVGPLFGACVARAPDPTISTSVSSARMSSPASSCAGPSVWASCTPPGGSGPSRSHSRWANVGRCRAAP
jgi:hypothetical protein